MRRGGGKVAMTLQVIAARKARHLQDARWIHRKELTMSEQSKLAFGAVGAEAEAFQYAATSSRAFSDVLASVVAEIDRAGLKLLQEIDVQKALAGAGRVVGGFRLLFFFHPDLVIRVISADVSAMVEPPLKLVVVEKPDGTVSLRIAEPALAFGRYGNPALAELGTELSATVRRIVQSSL